MTISFRLGYVALNQVMTWSSTWKEDTVRVVGRMLSNPEA